MNLELLLVGDRPARDLLSHAQLAEANGYDTVWVADERFYRDTYGLLTLLACNTTKVNLGPGITDPFVRHPAITTAAIATLDDISGGRAVLGLGAGVSGFPQLGLEPRKAPTAMRETITLFRQLLTGERVDFQGEIIQFNDGKLDFKPLRPHIPVHLASNGPLGQRVAGAVADVAIMAGCGAPAEARAFKAEVARGAEKAGRDPASVKLTARLNTCISADGKAARDAVRMSAARYIATGKVRTLEAQGLALSDAVLSPVRNMAYSMDHSSYAPVLSQISDRHVDACTLAGTVEEVTEHVIMLREAGIDSLIVVPYACDGVSVEQVTTTMANNVWPALRGT